MVIETDPEPLTDAELIHDALCGDETAYSALYGRYQSRLLSGLRLSLPEELAEDAAQEAWIRAYEHLPELARPDAFFAWLAAIARNSGRNANRRSEGVRIRYLDEYCEARLEPAPDPATTAEQGETRSAAAAAFRRIPESQRRALVMRWIQGRSYESIATLLGKSVSAVETLLYRARANFHRQFESAASGMQASRGLACYKMRSNLRALEAGALSPLRRRRVLVHLEECGRCRAVHAEMGDGWARGAAFLPLIGMGPLAGLRGLLKSAGDKVASAFGGAGGGAAVALPLGSAVIGVASLVSVGGVAPSNAIPGNSNDVTHSVAVAAPHSEATNIAQIPAAEDLTPINTTATQVRAAPTTARTPSPQISAVPSAAVLPVALTATPAVAAVEQPAADLAAEDVPTPIAPITGAIDLGRPRITLALPSGGLLAAPLEISAPQLDAAPADLVQMVAGKPAQAQILTLLPTLP